MSLAKLREIEARTAAASHGPWEANLESDHGDYIVWGPGPHEFIANVGSQGTVAFDVAKANAIFMAAAREDVPALCRALLVALEALEGIQEQQTAGRAFQAALEELWK